MSEETDVPVRVSLAWVYVGALLLAGTVLSALAGCGVLS